MESGQAAPASFANKSTFKKKKTAKDPLASLFYMAAVLGIIVCCISMLMSLLS